MLSRQNRHTTAGSCVYSHVIVKDMSHQDCSCVCVFVACQLLVGCCLPFVWCERNEQMDLICSICLQAWSVCVFVRAACDSQWVNTVRRSRSHPWCVRHLQGLFTPLSKAHMHLLCSFSNIHRTNQYSYLYLRHKSMVAFLIDGFVIVLEKQLLHTVGWSHGLITGAEEFLRKALFPL